MPAHSELTDNQLVEKSLEDTDFFGVLVDRYEQKLLYYILRISSFDLLEAEEILQEVFLKAWRNIQDFDQSLSFSSWMYRIAHNQTISEYRKHKSRGNDQAVELDDERVNSLVGEIDIEAQVDQKFLKEKVMTALGKMSLKYREVLVLQYFEDLSYEEIADVIKKPSGTVATLINRAKKQFIKCHSELDSESSLKKNSAFMLLLFWIPASAGMTVLCNTFIL